MQTTAAEPCPSPESVVWQRAKKKALKLKPRDTSATVCQMTHRRHSWKTRSCSDESKDLLDHDGNFLTDVLHF